MAFDRKYMERAIELAKKGEGGVNPNPLVGAVIVKENRIIGEGYHARYGELHAERAAFANLMEDAEGADMYVTLEPCCHFGKQPPCVEAIVRHKIKNVYVGSDDPNEKVGGKGIEYLRNHGIEVTTQVMKEECDALNPVFFHYITTKLPYVVMKYAMTMDGKIATSLGLSKWITGEKARERVQYSRNKYMGIMVGIGTVIKDNPMLNCRIDGGRNPVRIVCDTGLNIPVGCNIVTTACDIRTIVATGIVKENSDGYEEYKSKADILTSKGIEVIGITVKGGHIDLNELMIRLGEMGIDSILLEGGGKLNYSALMADVVNEIQVYVAPKIFGGEKAVTPVEGEGVQSPDKAFEFDLKNVENIGKDILLTYIKEEVKR